MLTPRGSTLLLLLSLSWCTTGSLRIWNRGQSKAKELQQPTASVSDLQDSIEPQRKRILTKPAGLNLQTKVPQDRGIIISAGGRRLLTNALVILKVLREALNSSLPVEVFYYGSEEADNELFAKLKEVHDVYLRDGSIISRSGYLSPWPSELHGYAKKVFSLHSTGFKQVLLLDSDSQPLIQPEQLFEWPLYKKYGAVFWPDYWGANTAAEAPKLGAYALLGLQDPSQDDPAWACVESGQLLFNKARHMDVLDWVLWINLWADVMYQYVLGDKDTYEMGFMLSNKHEQFFRIPAPPRTAVTQRMLPANVFFHVGMVHSMGEVPAFLHRTSGGKFDLDKEPIRHLRPAFLTEPMSVAAAKRFIWDTGMAINVLPSSLVMPDLPQCDKLSKFTIAALNTSLTTQKLRRSMLPIAKGYTKCTVHHDVETSIPIPLLPIALFGNKVGQAINHSYRAFAQLRQSISPDGDDLQKMFVVEGPIDALPKSNSMALAD